MAIFFELFLIFSYLGSRPTMADKILRRTSYGGEQTENISKFWPLKATISRRHFLVTFYFQSFQIPWFKSIGKIKRLVLNLNFSWKLQFFRGRKLCGILSDFIINKSQVIYKYLFSTCYIKTWIRIFPISDSGEVPSHLQYSDDKDLSERSKLQRAKGQSRKTFKLRKTRKEVRFYFATLLTRDLLTEMHFLSPIFFFFEIAIPKY